MLTIEDVMDVMTFVGRNTVPAGGQRALAPDEHAARAADWLQVLAAMGIDREQLQRAAATCIAGSRWRPELADIVAALRGPAATPKGVEAVAAEDLAALDRWAGVVAGMGGVLPDWSAIRAAVADTSRATRARSIFGDTARVDRIADAVYRLGGWPAVVRARTGERIPGSDPWRDYGFSWRTLYGGTEAAPAAAQMLASHAAQAIGNREEPRQLTDREAQAFQAELAARLGRRA